MANTPLAWNEADDLAHELLRDLKALDLPPRVVAKAERLQHHVEHARETLDAIRTAAHGGLYCRSSIDKCSRAVAVARYRDRPGFDD